MVGGYFEGCKRRDGGKRKGVEKGVVVGGHFVSSLCNQLLLMKSVNKSPCLRQESRPGKYTHTPTHTHTHKYLSEYTTLKVDLY